jgi:hypothetical protein
MKMCLYGLYAVIGDNSQSRRGKEPMQRLESLHTPAPFVLPPLCTSVVCSLQANSILRGQRSANMLWSEESTSIVRPAAVKGGD